MLITPAKNVDWTSMDAKRLADILQSEFGQKLIQNWMNNAPSLLDGSDVNKTLVASGQVKGYSQALEVFVTLSHEQPALVEKQPETHPSLDSDDGWPKELQLAPQPSAPTK